MNHPIPTVAPTLVARTVTPLYLALATAFGIDPARDRFRVWQIAKVLGMDSKSLLTHPLLGQLGARTASSSVLPSDADLIASDLMGMDVRLVRVDQDVQMIQRNDRHNNCGRHATVIGRPGYREWLVLREFADSEGLYGYLVLNKRTNEEALIAKTSLTDLW